MAEVGCLKDGHFQNLQVNGLQYPGRVPIVNLGAARTFLPEESGTVFTVESSGGAYDVTLPTVALGRGCRFRFIAAENTPNADITINNMFSSSANCTGSFTKHQRITSGKPIPLIRYKSSTGTNTNRFYTSCSTNYWCMNTTSCLDTR